jgi:serine/threonine protein kinase/tetratricopeptide (TPR) repeat protein
MKQPAPTARAVFDHAVEIDSPAERKAYLDEVCAEAPELRDRVEGLLRAHEQAGSFLQTPAGGLPEATGPYQPGSDTSDQSRGAMPETVDHVSRPNRSPGAEGPGSWIGAYRLVKKLGEGGMGAVYLAEQEQPIRREVALKIIKPGMDSAQVVARFNAERQALSLMDHVHIARVFEAGATDLGRPYFVMELVKGTPLTRFCDDYHLGVRERLELFETVCQAIQHAHQKGVIHRDIKPSNVLVALHEGKPMAKVIDFGLAKAIEQPLTDESVLTLFGGIVGTLAYMSPEQAEFSAPGVDTRTDVYSLGVVLYELLTGTTPLDGCRQKSDGLPEVLRKVREVDPPRPSAWVAGLGDRLPAMAEVRKAEPGRLAKVLRGELDWIAMKALEKDRERRYESAGELAKDVRRYLDDEPVQACPPSRRYLLGKFARKHWKVLGTVAAIVMALVGGIIGIDHERVRAVIAEKETRKLLGFAETNVQLSRGALVMADSVIEALIRDRTRLGDSEKQLLRKLLKQNQFQNDPDTSQELLPARAERQFRMAKIAVIIEERADAKARYRRAIELYEQLATSFPDQAEYRNELARANCDLGYLLREMDRRAEAEAAYRRGIELHERVVEDFPEKARYSIQVADGYNDLGTLLRDRKDLAGAEKAFRGAIAIREKAAPELSDLPVYRVKLAAGYHNLGNAVRDQGNRRAALASYGKAIDLLTPIKESSPSATEFLRNAHWDRANALGQLGQHAQAIQDWKAGIELAKMATRQHLRRFLAAERREVALKAQTKPTPQDLYEAAGVFAQAMKAAIAEDERDLKQRYASRALGMLKQAREAGWFRDPQRIAQIKDDPAFQSPDFKPFLDSLQAAKGKQGPPGTK